MNKNQNNNCSNHYCVNPYSEIRWLPTGGDSNLLLCKACYEHEMSYRRERNIKLAKDCMFDIPAWIDLRIYDASN